MACSGSVHGRRSCARAFVCVLGSEGAMEGVVASEGREAGAEQRLLERLRAGGRIPVLGVTGGARGLIGARVARALGAPVVAVAADEEGADRLAGDLAFFLG